MFPNVSVVLTALGDAPGLGESLAAVAAQTHAVAEIIVVSDRDRDLPAGVTPSPTLRHTGPGDVPTATAWNVGLRSARQSYVQFLDAGDVLTPIAIASGLACARRSPAAAFVHGAHRDVDVDGTAVGARRRTDLGHNAYTGLLEGRLIDAHAAVLYRRDVLQECGGFREDFSGFADYDVQLRLSRAHAVAAHATETVRQRFRGGKTDRARADLRNLLEVHDAHRPAPTDPAEWREAWRAGERRFRDRFARDVLAEARSDGRSLTRAVMTAAALSPGLVAREIAGRALTQGARALPAPLGDLVARHRPELRPLGLGRVRLGDLDRTRPVSQDFGFDRGLPLDRYYVENFLRNASADVHGRVLEVGDAAYSRRFGGSRIDQQDVVHVHADNPEATIVGDVSQPGTLPRSAFDCIVFTQTLHLIYDMRAAVEALHAALKPGGVLLLTVPGISQIDRGEWGEQWFWSLTPAAVRRLLGEAFGDEAVTVTGHGNVYAATAFLQGMSLSEVDVRKLDVHDEAYPVIVTAHATKYAPRGSDDVGEGALGAGEVGEPTHQDGDG